MTGTDSAHSPVRRRLPLLLVLICLSVSGRAQAQQDDERDDVDTGGLTIEAVAGWDGVVDTMRPIPLSFEISNYSGRDIDGRLVLSDPLSGHELSLGDVYVSQESTRHLSAIQAMPDWHECFATLYDGYRVVWRRELPLTTGRDFSTGSAFVLCVSAEGRAAPLPEGNTKLPVLEQGVSSVAGKEGRLVECLGVKPWQIPRHPGPLSAVQAILFPQQFSADQLNSVQWQAVADWMCQGGLVLVDRSSETVIRQLNTLAPLGSEPEQTTGVLTTQNIGLGLLVTFSAPLFAEEGRETAAVISQLIGRRPLFHASTHFSAMQPHYYRSGRADANRAKILAFFAGYMFFSGLLTLLLFRLSRRRIAIWTITVVLGASVLSGLLGGMLRVSEGDLRWMTVTQVGAGGGVQTGRIEVQSSGGRNTQVGLRGNRVDLQTHTVSSYRHHQVSYYGQPSQVGWAPFTYQPSLAEQQPDLYRLKVPMTPWGTQTLQATAFVPDLKRLRCELTFEGSASPEAAGDPREHENPGLELRTHGRFTMKLVNPMPVSIKEGWLLIGAPHEAGKDTRAHAIAESNSYGWGALTIIDDMIDAYHLRRLNTIEPESEQEFSFDAAFSLKHPWDLQESWHDDEGGCQYALPRLTQMGTASAWIIGRLSDSPTLSIDQDWSEFEDHNAMHLFVQQLQPEEMRNLNGLILQDQP